MSMSVEEKFERWVKRPIAALRALPEGDGTFAALAIAFGLYERLIKSELTARKEGADHSAFFKAAAADLGSDVTAFKKFWESYRVGIQHQFQPRSFVDRNPPRGSFGWEMGSDDGFKGFPEVIEVAANSFLIKINPWKFIDHLLERWSKSKDLMNQIREFSLGYTKKGDAPSIDNRSWRELTASDPISRSDPPHWNTSTTGNKG